MKAWKILQRPITLEAGIPLKSEAPAEIRVEYEISYSNRLVAWVSSNGKLCGVIQNNRSVVADLRVSECLTLYEMKPAKGWGWVGITIKDSHGNVLYTLFESRHSEKSLEWLQATQDILADVFGLRKEFQDLGCDA